MKVQPESEKIDFIVESLDADLLELRPLQEFLREKYQEGVLERFLHFGEQQWYSYVSHYCGPTSLVLGSPKSYWGSNPAEKEENFLCDLNELRCAIGRPPIPPHVYMKSYTEHAVTLYTAFKSAFRQRQKVTGPPKLPPDLERRIFETCALESPEVCTVLVLVASRVHMWIDPILIATVCIMEDFESIRQGSLEHFLAKLTNGKPVEYYAKHIKNLAILGAFFSNEDINRILAICSGVENLVLLAPAWGLDFFENPQAGRNLRRLTINLQKFSRQFPNFYHPCFANLTHLHLWDDDDDWPTYAGWETLVSLTHLAFACSGPPETTKQLIQTLPTVRYVALGYYSSGERYNKYVDAIVDNGHHIRAAWGVRVVFFSVIPRYDWERGARGEGDFWDLVEREVERRLEEGSVD
ncbi:hypothetical protein B0H10DRAFT_2008415 [Mycena sp. CBHHK59/15]|nr:hypothetical protein B0H10DRAFT_2008415 [Mycena sp. CBHHK59/15]